MFQEGRQIQLQGVQQENQQRDEGEVHGWHVVKEVWIWYQQRVPLNGQPGIYLPPGEEWLLVETYVGGWNFIVQNILLFLRVCCHCTKKFTYSEGLSAFT